MYLQSNELRIDPASIGATAPAGAPSEREP